MKIVFVFFYYRKSYQQNNYFRRACSFPCILHVDCYCNSTLSLTGSNPFPCLLEFLLAECFCFFYHNEHRQRLHRHNMKRFRHCHQWCATSNGFSATRAPPEPDVPTDLHSTFRGRGPFTQYSNSYSHKVSMICHAGFR